MALVKAGYWLEDGGFPLENIDSTLFTHIFFAFSDLESNRVVVPLRNQAAASRFTDVLRSRNPSVKTLLSIGGGLPPTLADDFAIMVASPENRRIFIASSIQIARSYKFDGLDLDYEFPKKQEDMSNLGSLLREWRAAVNGESSATNKPALLLTAAVRYTNINYSDPPNPYPAQDIVTSLDWINLMAYDFTTPEQTREPHTTGATAELRPTGVRGINAWIQAGVPRKKLVLGIPFYGYAWTLTDPFNNGYGAPADGPAIDLAHDGLVNYNVIVEFVRNNGGVTVYDENKVGAYSYVDRTWISYDNEAAVADKVKYVKEEGLLGYFAWEIGADDNFALARAAFDAAAL